MRLRDINTDKINRRTMDYLTALHIYFEGHKIHKQNDFGDYYLDGEGEGRFSKRLQYTLGINSLTKEPGGLFPLRLERTIAVSTGAGQTPLTLEADKEEIWDVKHATLIHNDVKRAVTLNYTPQLPSPEVMTLVIEDVPTSTPTGIFPIFHDTVGTSHDHIVSFHPFRVQRGVANFTVSVAALALDKVVIVDWLYERVK